MCSAPTHIVIEQIMAPYCSILLSLIQIINIVEVGEKVFKKSLPEHKYVVASLAVDVY